MIATGKSPNKPWIGEKITCEECKCKFELEDGDSVKFESTPEGEYYTYRCPECKEKIYINVLDLVDQ